MAKKTTKKASAKTKKRIEKKDMEKRIWFQYDDNSPEIREHGQKLSAAFTQKVQLELEFAEVKKKWKGKIDKQEALMKEHNAVIKNKGEFKTVEVTEVKNFQTAMVQYKQGNKVLEERDMTPAERQMSMSVEDKDDSKDVEKKLREDAKKFKDGKDASKSKNNVTNVHFPNMKNRDSELTDVIKEETNRSTKKSSVDGPGDGARP